MGGAAIEFLTLKYYLLFALLLSLCFKEGGASRSLSMDQVDEDLEIERQLRILNKPPVKTIHTEWGVILDCVDINKQPAFDHPLLKDHKIQLKPSLIPLKGDEKSSSTQSNDQPAIFKIPDESCPKGTVPIRRTSREDLITAKYETKFAGERLEGLRYNNSGETYFGAFAEINVYKPQLATDDQFSSAEIAVENGLDGIRVGWMVNPKEFNGSHNTHLFTLWTNDGYKTVCYNNNPQCPGFVQVDSSIGPGSEITNTSTYDGDQYKIPLKLYQEKKTGRWWLVVTDQDNQEKNVGYWPKELFTSLSGGCSQIYWGGHVKASAGGLSPEMGSGHYPTSAHNYQRACYYKNLKYLDGISYTFLNPIGDRLKTVKECDFYSLFYHGFQSGGFGHTFQFGGPGGQCS